MVILDKKKTGAILTLLIGIVSIIWINMLAQRSFQRIDLTEEGRYSIKPATKTLLENLEDVVYIEVYLTGELNADFKRLQRSIRETLEEFRVHAGSDLQYTFVDPAQAESAKARNEFMVELVNKGITATNLFDNEDGKRTEKLIFPGALVSYNGAESGVMLLKGNTSATAVEKLNQSIEGLEYELASVIDQLTKVEKETVGFVKGHGELDSLDLISLKSSLYEYYNIVDVDLSNRKNLDNSAALIIAKPTRSYRELEKYHLDQYLMEGGKAMFLMDMLDANMDSASSESNFAFPYRLNMEDQLFRYGIRINNDLVQDRTSLGFPINVGNIGDQPQIRMMPWAFYPLINRYADHPIVKNLDAVSTKFISTLDTVKAEGVKKTPLMFTSDYTRIVSAPVKVSLNDLRKNLGPEKFNRKNLPLAYLLEGNFTSLYKNRFLPEGAKGPAKQVSADTKIIVVGDGDFVKNELDPRTGKVLPLGKEPFAKVSFANEGFMLNALSYLIEGEGLITARANEVRIRPLDKVKADKEKLYWQVLNLLAPLVIMLLYGFLRYFMRKRKYVGPQTLPRS